MIKTSKIKSFSVLLILSMVGSSMNAQPWFKVETQVFRDGPTFSGTPLAVVDVNGDYLDDLIFLEQGNVLCIGYQDPFDHFFDKKIIGRVNKNPQWSMVVGDVDRNGLRDIVVAGEYDDLSVYYQEADSFRRVNHIIPIIYSQAMNLVDIDRDGWVDVFLCNDIRYNQVWWNRNGGLEEDTTKLFWDLPEDVSSGNYGSEWGDVDNDGDLDLFLAKCNARAMDPTDLRRVNRLYIQDDQGKFTEEAVSRGIASGAQSWTGQYMDIDNDGDLDILVTNHDQVAELMENDGTGHFTLVSPASGLKINGPVIQGIARDLNMDGQQDIVVGGFPDFLYEKRNGLRYRRIDHSLGLYDLTSLAVGDANNDGRYDLWANVGNLINLPSKMNDRLLLNQTPFRSSIDIYLAGSLSNPDGIGSMVRVYGDNGIQTFMVRAGESYGVQNSYKIIASVPDGGIDSIVVHWPLGLREVLYDAPSDGYILFWENKDIFVEDKIRMPMKYRLCPGEEKWIYAPSGYQKYTWRNGPQGDSLLVSAPGIYQCQVCIDSLSCLWLPPVIVNEGLMDEGEIKIMDANIPVCSDELVEIEYFPFTPNQNWQWMDGELNARRSIDSSGWYYVMVEDRCGSRVIDSIEVAISSPFFTEIREDSVSTLEEGLLTAVSSGSTTYWYREETDSLPFHTGDSLLVPPGIEKDTQFWVEPIEVMTFGSTRGGKSQVDAANPFHEDRLNATMIFEVQTWAILETVDVATDTPGRRAIQILDKNLDVVKEDTFDLDTGWNTLVLQTELDPELTPYRMTTNLELNLMEFGTFSPRLMSCDSAVLYPYQLGQVGYIFRSQYGYDVYNYFYNWKVRRMDLECRGDREPIILKKKTTTSTTKKSGDQIQIFPNPSMGVLTVNWNRDKIYMDESKVEIFDLQGRRIDFEWAQLGDGKAFMRIEHRGTFLLRIDGVVKVFQVL